MVKKLSCVSCGSLKRFPHTFTTVNDVLVDPHPFLFWSIHTLFTALTGCGSTKLSLTVHAVVVARYIQVQES
jgi:hypothetical protein